MSAASRPFPASALLAAAVFACAGQTWAMMPLVTDDTGTQGTGNGQFEFSADQTRTRDAGVTTRELALGAALTYGLTETLDLSVGLPWLRNRATGAPTESGIGDITLLAKWRFFDNDNGWTLGLRPEVTLPTGSESRGLGNGRATAALRLLSSLESGDWTWLANVGYAYNDNDLGDRRNLWAASTALLYGLDDRWTFAADVGANRSATPGASTEGFAELAVIYHLGKSIDLDLGWLRTLGPHPVGNTVSAGVTLRW